MGQVQTTKYESIRKNTCRNLIVRRKKYMYNIQQQKPKKRPGSRIKCGLKNTAEASSTYKH
uniref:Uncharacterized protein n=1 Tax=Anguilla anguilla TaxID=7936 RepID=A0A0E9WQL2_ANGAN